YKFFENGFVYKGLRSTYWCIHDETALAEAEVEYENHTSPSIWVKFAIADGPISEKIGKGVQAVIWTTTPWTLPANRALCFHPDFDYCVIETEKGALLVAEPLISQAAAAMGVKVSAKRGPWKGHEFEGVKFQHPFLDLQVPGVLGDYVTLEAGTGIVHTAPGHGAEDFYTGQKYGLEAYAPQNDEGRFIEGLDEYKGKTVFEANPHIIELLKKRGALLGEGKLTHSYPHCWRCHKPVIFRATEQWFIGMQSNDLREKTLAEIKKVKWTPGWGEERMASMVSERPDWCISRQRMWGVPLIVFHCGACGKRLENFAALRHAVKFFETEGADAWFSRSSEELLPPGTKCACGKAQWVKENDILDVWFDSGSSHLAVLDTPGTSNPNGAGHWPANLYLEGPDQFRGWFQSSLLVSMGTRGRAPYGQVLAHGWTLDETGVIMSKSRGTGVVPREFCEKWGADLLRLWVASQDFTSDVSISDAMMKQLAEAYRKLRNTFRWILGNLDGFDPARDAVPAAEMDELDRWMLEKTSELTAECLVWYENFEFHRVFHRIHDFAIVDLSAFYFDVRKDRLYTAARNSQARRSAQTAIWNIGTAVLRLLAPILVYTTEEIWKYFPKAKGTPESVHMAEFPKGDELDTHLDESKDANWELLRKVRNEVLKALEPHRQSKFISGSLEARVVLHAGDELHSLLQNYASFLPALFITSQVGLTKEATAAAFRSDALPDLAVSVERAAGAKCERCWNFSTHVGENVDYPTICERCTAALNEIERGAAAS
ncbi:MAG: isoleucine--tRNA ligase, partial [Acidobacteria bacterium]|nr:isoleucine--tRNA ligase [Acidobacteriota bacterium]